MGTSSLLRIEDLVQVGHRRISGMVGARVGLRALGLDEGRKLHINSFHQNSHITIDS